MLDVPIVEGTFEEGSEVTINVVTYTVEGHTLVIKETGGEETESTFVGTWSGQVGMNTINLVLNEDGKGTYNDFRLYIKSIERVSNEWTKVKILHCTLLTIQANKI